MFSVTHFRSEFIRQAEATILRRVTMTQFLGVIAAVLLGVGLFRAPYWLAPLFIALGYLAGYRWQGEILLRRLLAYAAVRLRSAAGAPTVLNLQAEWDTARAVAERRQGYD